MSGINQSHLINFTKEELVLVRTILEEQVSKAMGFNISPIIRNSDILSKISEIVSRISEILNKETLAPIMQYKLEDTEWKTKDKRTIKFKDMDDTHILNSLSLLRKKAFNEIIFGTDSVFRRRKASSLQEALKRTKYFLLLDYAKVRKLNVSKFEI